MGSICALAISTTETLTDLKTDLVVANNNNTSLVFPMCILISCSSVLCVLMALGMFMFVKVRSSLISVMRPLLVCAICLCVWWCSGVSLVF